MEQLLFCCRFIDFVTTWSLSYRSHVPNQTQNDLWFCLSQKKKEVNLLLTGCFGSGNVNLCVIYLYLLFPQTSKDDLIQTDFEGALKFFRVPVPKRYRSEENAKKLMELACSMKVSLKHAVVVPAQPCCHILYKQLIY